jgi:hypothetical protein
MIALNVGCHDIRIDGFENLDINPEMKPDVVRDCTKLSMYYKPGSVDMVYMGHFLEHFKIEDSAKIVRDVHFILKDYGICCCVCPDYTKVPPNPDEAERIILGAGEHMSIFNDLRLLQIFKEQGFTTFPVDVRDVPWTPFPQISWQSSVLAVKHPKVSFR